ncbi:hypothetical protein F5X98DRAFT_380475 [Xylaria grammica]|nr:hypothetical protein F5X98DRAFT_380475 [Xylaria grammica]
MDSTAGELRHQWANPSDILSLLLLIGGDIVQKAIAQLNTPVNAYPVDPRPEEDGGRAESLRIDIFRLKPPTGPDPDFVWWSGWFIIIVPIAIAVVPWVRFGDWGILLVTLSGSVFTISRGDVDRSREGKGASAL